MLACTHQHNAQHFTPKEVTARLVAAKEHCSKRHIRFTPLRQQIYTLVLKANKPVGAYDLITQLQQERVSAITDGNATKNVAPPTVYRTLEFLLSEGLIHQLTSINAYVPCCHPREGHQAAFLICQNCHSVKETSANELFYQLKSIADQGHFQAQNSVIEISGMCQQCQ